MRRRIGWWLRCLADRIDREHSACVSHWSFTFERGVGVVFRDDGAGCPLWYPADQYERAHTEARNPV